ncbi:hypothetical protein AYO44_07900 [Planctomycetaceae bacterium SCGC AG-212-F19]|nr:hypothetical protein AYO44_07900 [Planctomycetaceae bacterium SCGC AG-212-F19]
MPSSLSVIARAVRRLVALLAGVVLTMSAVLAQQPGLSIADVPDVSQETKTPIKIALKATGAGVKFSVNKVRKGGKPTDTPKNLAVDADTGVVTWTPTPSQAGTYEITVTAKEGKDNEASTTVRITVRPRDVTMIGGEVGKLLKQWYAEGSAAGNVGDFYDNRDRDHSALHRPSFPQLDEVIYSPDDLKVRRDWAAQHTILPHVTFGNSSTSAPVTGGGSNVRMYYTHPRGMTFLYEEYRKNNIYMYPAHHDHHPGHNGKPFYGDVFPANSPYLVTSQGSSGSDQPFMRAVPLTLAAFRPEVKQKLIETGLLMPTIQMILRISNKHLTDPKEYLTGKAHPPVFEGSWVNDLKMIQMAHEMQVGSIPPMIQLRVVEEDRPVAMRDFFDPGIVEVLHDTPAAIARVVRGPKYVRRMVVSAEDSFDANKRPLTYHWAVLRGDAERIKINPLNDAGSRVEILVPYHQRRQVDGHHLKIESNRVDIGAFVHNGTYNSAPGFVTLHTLDNELRTYDDSGKLLDIGYGAGDADLTVTDWNALFDTLASEEKTFGVERLRRGFTAEHRKAIAEVAGEYRTAAAALTAAQATSAQADKARQKAAAELKPLAEKAAAAQKANEKDPTDETLKAYKEAVLLRDAAEDVRKTAEAAYQTAQKGVDAARKTADGILTAKKAGLDAPTKELAEAALSRIRQDATLVAEHAKDVEMLLEAAEAPHKQRVAAARRQLAGLGIMTADGPSKLTPVHTGEKPLAERLTRFEKNMIERFNAELLAALVYPKFVTHNFKVNLVDFRLTTHKYWRDVYRHDAKGNIIGWMRHDGTKSTEFNAAGLVVLDKDDKGRAIKARTVQYELDATIKPPAVRPLKQVPGDQIHYYEYDGDADFIGRVTKMEKVEEKK